mgnify:CR=1 FL=1
MEAFLRKCKAVTPPNGITAASMCEIVEGFNAIGPYVKDNICTDEKIIAKAKKKQQNLRGANGKFLSKKESEFLKKTLKLLMKENME